MSSPEPGSMIFFDSGFNEAENCIGIVSFNFD